MSVLVMHTLGRDQFLLHCLRSEHWVEVPKILSRRSKASLVHTHSLPKWPPGASFNIERLFTLQSSRPGRFLNAFYLSASPLWIRRGPFFILKRLFLYFPTPARIFLECQHWLRSSPRPSLLTNSFAFLVLSTTTSKSTTNGSSANLFTLCPRPCTNAVRAEALTVDATANLLLLRLVLRVHLLQTRLGLYMCPPLQLLAKAPDPDACVPPPFILGTLATALPGPQDSADYP